MQLNRDRMRGFTLIELLVVVAIISILAGILFPVFALAREKARQSNCLSNCRHIGQAIMLYADDYDSAYPLYAHAPKHDNLWYEVILPYLKVNEIFGCPSVRGKVLESLSARIGYGVNYSHVIMYGKGLGDGPQYIYRLDRPSETIMLADSQVQKGSNAGKGWPAIYCPVHNPLGPTWYKDLGLDKTWALSDRHNGGGNYVFADGHAKWMRRDTVINWSRERGEELWGHYRKGP